MTDLCAYPTPGDALAAQARLRGDAEALVFPSSGGRLTFAAWHARSTALARGLLEIGCAAGSHVALLAENRLDWPVVQLAAAMIGGVLVPLNTHYRLDDLRYALAQSKAQVLFLSPSFRSNSYLDNVRRVRSELPDLRHLVVLDPVSDGQADTIDIETLVARGRQSDRALSVVRPSDVGSLQYTSGTTGFPKGALLTHLGMLGDSWGSAGRLGIRPGDRWTSIIPLFHCAGCIMNVLGCLQVGACYVGLPAFDPEAMFALIEAERCTVLSGVPTSYLAMLQHPRRGEYDLSSLRTGTCGGADADPAILERCAAEFPIPQLCQVYGQTEVNTLVSCPSSDDPLRFSTTGRPLPGLEVRVTDPATRRVLPADETGEIEARGALVMVGYFEKPEATAEALSRDGWLRTGDLGRITPSGHVVMAGGRLRDMIIRGGENIYPMEIEQALQRHEAVIESAVFALPDAYYGEIVGAAVRLRAPVAAADLAAFCAARIARFKVPARFFRVEAFPLTASGKIRKVALREEFAAGRLVDLA